ncbi:MAG: hypothetical protein F6K08_26445 [Okeania sp. SIO1H6]|uniref:Uncharacterized protein n=1 Tax=Okeania hirsuta TaxID=1458930 RepID=A0A3N6PJ27_9CYAN|nr:hypothetical protein [Okeania sp. SIO1H4]NES92422.1 hypothetical protein [Okeania sp. SIO2B9]NET16113.1 hypothetical protein [Okeania sp. SIO1H6]NET21402.1 hypothetical protein [Okeania sp. SIO1H5]NET77230.1 hypothetical protein [Okeania sp. SIO1F9]NET93934.1 hypothetical protein [Okeania sp. SIO1H2]RQH39025.1 hypothetical protein D5R40_17165 [Okeania hirsuta]
MPKQAKGKRPVYLDNTDNDKLLAIIMALAGEVSVLRERLDTIEKLLVAKSIIFSEDIENYQPDAQVNEEREQWRTDYITRILRVIDNLK